jgi:histidine ammonia-lyase
MATAAVLNELRKTVPKWESDRLMHRDIEAAVGFIRSGQIISVVEQICGQLI